MNKTLRKVFDNYGLGISIAIAQVLGILTVLATKGYFFAKHYEDLGYFISTTFFDGKHEFQITDTISTYSFSFFAILCSVFVYILFINKKSWKFSLGFILFSLLLFGLSHYYLWFLSGEGTGLERYDLGNAYFHAHFICNFVAAFFVTGFLIYRKIGNDKRTLDFYRMGLNFVIAFLPATFFFSIFALLEPVEPVVGILLGVLVAFGFKIAQTKFVLK